VSRVADAEETFTDISEYVSLIINGQQPLSLWQMRSTVSKPATEMPDCTRKHDLPTCPAVSLYGMSHSSLICGLIFNYLHYKGGSCACQ